MFRCHDVWREQTSRQRCCLWDKWWTGIVIPPFCITNISLGMLCSIKSWCIRFAYCLNRGFNTKIYEMRYGWRDRDGNLLVVNHSDMRNISLILLKRCLWDYCWFLSCNVFGLLVDKSLLKFSMTQMGVSHGVWISLHANWPTGGFWVVVYVMPWLQCCGCISLKTFPFSMVYPMISAELCVRYVCSNIRFHEQAPIPDGLAYYWLWMVVS